MADPRVPCGKSLRCSTWLVQQRNGPPGGFFTRGVPSRGGELGQGRARAGAGELRGEGGFRRFGLRRKMTSRVNLWILAGGRGPRGAFHPLRGLGAERGCRLWGSPLHQ